MHFSIISSDSANSNLCDIIFNIASKNHFSISIDEFVSFKDYIDNQTFLDDFSVFIDLDSVTKSCLDIVTTLRANNFFDFIIFYHDKSLLIPLENDFYNVNFFKKPLSESSLSCFVENIINRQLKIISSQIYTFKCDNETHRIPYNEILYFSSSDHYVKVFTISGNRYLHYTTLKALEAFLPSNFLRIHRTYIVNIQHITHIHFASNSIRLTSDSALPFSRCYVPDASLLNAI